MAESSKNTARDNVGMRLRKVVNGNLDASLATRTQETGGELLSKAIANFCI